MSNTSSCRAGFKAKKVKHYDGTTSSMCKRVSGKAKPLTPKQKAAYAKRKGKKLSAITRQHMKKAKSLI